MLIDIICFILVFGISYYTTSYIAKKSYLQGFNDASKAMVIAISKLITPVDIVFKNDMFYVYDTSGSFIIQAASIEEVQSLLSVDKKKAYLLSKSTEGEDNVAV